MYLSNFLFRKRNISLPTGFITPTGLHIKNVKDAIEVTEFYTALGSMLSKWLDVHVGVHTDVNFSEAFITSNGRFLLDIATNLTGYKPGGISTVSLGIL
jgi:hypothetical protein